MTLWFDGCPWTRVWLEKSSFTTGKQRGRESKQLGLLALLSSGLLKITLNRSNTRSENVLSTLLSLILRTPILLVAHYQIVLYVSIFRLIHDNASKKVFSLETFHRRYHGPNKCVVQSSWVQKVQGV